MLDWRKIEAALERLFREYGTAVDREGDSGDVVTDDLNLTELAKDLAKELER